MPLLLLLASCGGGSGGSGGPVSGGSGGSDPLPPSGPAPARVSKIKPRPGSVTQSSNLTDIISIVPIQEIEEYTVNVPGACIAVEPGGSCPPQKKKRYRYKGFNVKNGNKWVVENLGSLKTLPKTSPNNRYISGSPSPINNEYLSEYLALKITGTDLSSYPLVNHPHYYDKNLGSLDKRQRVKAPHNLDLGVSLKRGYTGTDYMALGWWTSTAFVDVQNLDWNTAEKLLREAIENANYGVFVDGSDPFTSSVSSLTGRATYSGPIEIQRYNTDMRFYKAWIDAHQVCDACIERAQKIVEAERNYNETISAGSPSVYGNINLTADFGDASSLGHIEGRIDNIKGLASTESLYMPINNGSTIVAPLPGSLNLERAAIGESHSGFFAGNVSGRLNQKQYSGQWGGQFYGNGSSHPETVAGTMAVSSEDEHIHLMAPWAADRR